MDHPRAGRDYPRSADEFQAWFGTDADCLDYLDWLRWPDGFACPDCGHAGGWRLGDGRYECGGCHRRTSVMAGTIFDRTRTPLTVWFTACWLFATQKDGISALAQLQRALEIGSYQTAWAMLHRLRSVLVRPGRDQLCGVVEAGETFIGGEEAGLRGAGQGQEGAHRHRGRGAGAKGIGRCRMAVLAHVFAALATSFVTSRQPGTGSPPTPGRATAGWMASAMPTSGAASGPPGPAARSRRAAARRPPVRLAGQAVAAGHPPGRVDDAHLPGYPNGFTFRFNRPRSRRRGLLFYRMLELAAGHDRCATAT